MPVGINYRDITDSRAIESLNDSDCECFFYRLLHKVDAFGRTEASPDLLRSRCYPLRVDRVRMADISRWIAACEKAGLIALYQSDSKKALVIKKFGQRLYYNSVSDFHDPPADVDDVARFADRPLPPKGKTARPGLRRVTRGNAASSAFCSLPSAYCSPSGGVGEDFEDGKTESESAKKVRERAARKVVKT